MLSNLKLETLNFKQNMLKHSLQFKLSQKLSPQQIQLMKLIQLPTQAFEQRLQEELVENPALEESSKEDNYDLDDYGSDTDDYDDYDNEHIDTGDINIDDYLSNDETPDYKYQTNNYSDDDEDKTMPFAAPVSFHQDLINQLNTFILTDEEREDNDQILLCCSRARSPKLVLDI